LTWFAIKKVEEEDHNDDNDPPKDQILQKRIQRIFLQ